MRLNWLTGQFTRKYCTSSPSKYFVTTPIYYVNAEPHIGHLYSSVIADCIQRWQIIKNKNVKIKFSTGTDEHGTKIQQAAKNHKIPLLDYCDNISNHYKQLARDFSVNYTDFIRTTDENHKKCVKLFWNKIKENGFIYSSKYKGWYCVSDECFLTESQLKEVVINGDKTLVSAESGHKVEWTEETNYVFKLSQFQSDLIQWIKQNEVVRPKKFQKILLDTICGDDLPDISISRPSSRVHWGIPVPDDETQTIYVWLDALVNYLSVAGYTESQNTTEFKKFWPPDQQVIGKDILKFHGIYWPAFLMAANLELPKSILCHSHWTVDGEKMSKSKRNVVCPFTRSELYSSDGLRYFLLREGVAHSDGNFSDTKIIRILNSELADTLGNLLSRCCGIALNPNQIFPEANPTVFEYVASEDVTKNLIGKLTALPAVCAQHYNDSNFYKVVDNIIATLHQANLFFETQKPWQLRKDTTKIHHLNAVLHLTMETLRVCGVLLQPITPNLAEVLLNKLSVERDRRFFQDLNNLSWQDPNFVTRKLSGETNLLFKRIMPEKKLEFNS